MHKGLKYAHLVTTDHVGSTSTPHYQHTKLDKNWSLRSHLRAKVYLLMLTRPDIIIIIIIIICICNAPSI